tara:strand:- start:4981 stop:5628 length:648 start_codon:yes stop_codon:yes gene_type:complete
MAKELDTQTLSDTEDSIFEREFDEMLKIQLPQRDIRDPFIQNKAYIKYALQVAKGNSGPGGEFAGRGARGGQLGWNIGRAQELRGTGVSYNWEKTYAAAGWQDHLGSSGTPVQVNEDALICVVGIATFANSPKLTMCKAHVMGDDLSVENLMPAFLRGTRIYTFQYPWLVTPKEYFYIRGYVQSVGDDEATLLFVTFAKASYLQSETASTQSGGT